MSELDALEKLEGVERLTLLFDAASGPDGLESALEQVVARGLERARCCYSQDVIMNQIVDFYGQVLGRHATA